MRNFQNLSVAQRAHALALAVTSCTGPDSPDGPPGVTPQLQRAAIAIPTNLAKGCGYDSRRVFARYIDRAAASAMRLDYLLLLARDLGVLSELQYGPLAAETIAVRRMCHALRQHVIREERIGS
jgi:four helix bundle protein